MKNNSGFTLIEVLIAMLVLAVGLLGLAGLQAVSLRNNLSAYNRTQATQLAYDMADRMRANVADTSNLATSIYNTVAPTAGTVQSDCKPASAPPSPATCTPQDMARNDLYEWNCAVAGGNACGNIVALLPAGLATIAGGLVGTAPNQHMMYTITINWDDNRDGSVDNLDPRFQMRFQL